MVQYEYISS